MNNEVLPSVSVEQEYHAVNLARTQQTTGGISPTDKENNYTQTGKIAKLFEILVEQMLFGGRDQWYEIFRHLTLSLGAVGGEVGIVGPSAFLGTKADPWILFSCGEYFKTSDRQDIIEFFYNYWSQRDAMPKSATAAISTEPPIACCVANYSKNELIGIVIWGDESTHFEDLTILRVLALLLVYLLNDKSGRSDSPSTRQRGEQRGDRKFPDGYVEGCSDMMNSLHREIEMLSQVDFPVLLLGETGVGKEHLAHLLHHWSNRSQGPFVAVNCAAIPTELLEAEMFGIGRGVASGVLERQGYFQLADGGTLFLDEIAELQPSLQAKLLRALQDKEVRQVGGTAVKYNVRVVAATNADLRRSLESGAFRKDLYYRIAGFVLVVPPLRERKGDLPLFIEHFLRLFSKDAGKTLTGLTLKTLELLNEYHWPGNVREFAHEMRRLVYLCPDGHSIDSSLLSPHIASPDIAVYESAASTDPSTFTLATATENMERGMIREALQATNGNRTQAAKLLGITRNGLAIKMERLEIKD